MISCGKERQDSRFARSGNGFYNMVVHTSAGMVAKPDSVGFLPYPGNWGHVPGSSIQNPKGKDSKPVEVILLSEYLPIGTEVEFRPVGLVKISGEEAWRDVVIGVPLDTSLQIIPGVRTFFDLQVKCISCVRILYEWLLNHKHETELPFRGWGTELEAEQFILDHSGD